MITVEQHDAGERQPARAQGAFGTRRKIRSVKTYVGYSSGRNIFDYVEYRQTWCRTGLESMVQKAMDNFTKKTGVELPYNMAKNPWERHAYCFTLLRRKEFGADEYVEKAARFAGFLNTVANNPGKFPGIVKAIRASVFGTRGMGSPHVRNWWKVIARFPSPHRLEKVLWGVKKRAGTIVASYSNRKVGWCHVIDAIIDAGTIRVGRLAVCAVARATFSRDQICTLLWSASSVEGYSLGYRRCRDALTRLGRANVIMRSDDSIVVRAMLASEAIFTCKNGYIVEGYRMEPRQAWVLQQKKNAGYFSRVYLAISGEKWQVYEDLPKNMEIAVDRVATSDVDVVAKYCDGGYGYVPIFFNEVGEQPLRQHYELRCLLKKFHDQPIVTAGQIRKQLDVEAYGNDEVAEFFARCVW